VFFSISVSQTFEIRPFTPAKMGHLVPPFAEDIPLGKYHLTGK
jgi:hypothetical protein